MLAAGGVDGGLFIYDLRKIQVPLFRLNGHNSGVKNVCFNEREKMQNQENERGRIKEHLNYRNCNGV
jgi:hypothetical protein